MRKRMLTAALAAVMVLATSMTAFAGQWQQDGANWRWQNDDGTYTVNTWQWIDGNNDGTAECYYFDASGAMLANTTTPDGYTVDADGAWTENGAKKTQAVETQAVKATGKGKSSAEIIDYLINDKRDLTKTGIQVFIVDKSRPDNVESGATNIKNWRGDANTWKWHSYKATDYGDLICPIAFNEEGYLLVNTTTPDGYYVNEYGVLEIDGKEVTHSGVRCRSFSWKDDLHDKAGNKIENKNYCDLSNIDFSAETHNIGAEDAVPFGKLIYTHCRYMDYDDYKTEQGFGYCVKIVKDIDESVSGDDGTEPGLNQY